MDYKKYMCKDYVHEKGADYPSCEELFCDNIDSCPVSVYYKGDFTELHDEAESA